MMKILANTFFLAVTAFIFCTCENRQDNTSVSADAVLLRNATIIDGTGADALQQTDILIEDSLITAIGQHLDTSGIASVIDLTGKTVVPAFISAHVHVGTLKGTDATGKNYTRDNILRQLKKYADYGILNVLSMGTDRPLLFENGLYDSLKNGQLEGASMYSAGYGFGAPQGAPPMGSAMDKVYRPDSITEVAAKIDSLASLNVQAVKIWVDDFGGEVKKIDSAVYKTIISEAHRHNIAVVAHAYYLSDAHQLVADGVDVIGHSIRDQEVDDSLLMQMKEKDVKYIPTLTLDEFAYIYAIKPDWIEETFFKEALEPGVYEMITSADYQKKMKEAAAYTKNKAAFETALINLKKIFDAGILVALGTDSGASPVRAQGFAEHRELALLVRAGLTPLQAITVATQNAAKVLKIDDRFGTLEKGKIADLIVLNGNPLDDIKNTQMIEAVYKKGKAVSTGPIKD
ncbi:amidohydrolase family protein [Olivibacter sp. SDN3]|uniref:amidohydrolase family protein n=1 Tax=Olivibacter sp. SDN3 TaxID=2764720 RepID=UPI0021071F5B|nr:amidohydrolase family protein [Olivibacter sp. SDN3]